MQADAGRDCRTRLAKPNSQARTRTGKKTFSQVQLTTSRIGNLTRLILTLANVMTIEEVVPKCLLFYFLRWHWPTLMYRKKTFSDHFFSGTAFGGAVRKKNGKQWRKKLSGKACHDHKSRAQRYKGVPRTDVLKGSNLQIIQTSCGIETFVDVLLYYISVSYVLLGNN